MKKLFIIAVLFSATFISKAQLSQYKNGVSFDIGVGLTSNFNTLAVSGGLSYYLTNKNSVFVNIGSENKLLSSSEYSGIQVAAGYSTLILGQIIKNIGLEGSIGVTYLLADLDFTSGNKEKFTTFGAKGLLYGFLAMRYADIGLFVDYNYNLVPDGFDADFKFNILQFGIKIRRTF